MSVDLYKYNKPDCIDTEEVILARWGEQTAPLVSIICHAYNHAGYIENAIVGFLMQKTEFPYEIIIHDDASSDGTDAIISQYASRYPRLIKTVLQRENQYSKGIRIFTFTAPLIRGKYVALCEGDDFWTDPDKLNIQIQALADNAGIDLCFHPSYSLINNDTVMPRCVGEFNDRDTVVPVEKIISKGSLQIPTASLVLMANVFFETIKFISDNPHLKSGDIYYQIFGSLRGGSLYINRAMAVYRKLTPGSWTSRMSQDRLSFVKHLELRIIGYEKLNEKTGGRFKKELRGENLKWLLKFIRSASNGFQARGKAVLIVHKYYPLQSFCVACIIWLLAYLVLPLVYVRRKFRNV